MTQPDLFDPREPYNGMPGYKVGGTSQEAAEAIKPSVAYLQRAVLRAFADGGPDLTADECATILMENVLSIRPRFSELKEKGMIADTGQRRKNKSGRNAIVWALR